ncbi:c-type cytochrome [Algoriphagus sp. CAU 1675]|uniref:DUF7133 domain-containing protein n=1 Tax=Algoriphagus sp. CAU 1675 TaxID=3032597 RepID=UPI0023DAD453|nr:c-type cytochrome [Algoriphagus sp. CAU 1675]MDF2157097.1 c-type cytochrome [Algoriphagus sp. CAU 1675]
MSFSRILCSAFFIAIALSSCKKQGLLEEEGLSPARTAEEELETFQVEPGFRVELVASEPLVEDPVLIDFDEDGRLWVVEMRGYMTDIEGSEEDLPIGRISVLEDEDGDGKMDKSTIYLDSLVMPRALGLVSGGALVAENNSLWFTRDLDGDLIADSKELLDSTYASNGIPEHSDNGFLRNVDNWYYSAKSRLRYRYEKGAWIRDSTEFRGQWGIAQDDEGRLIYNYNWSQLHGDMVPANYLSRNANHQSSTGIDHGLTIDRKIFPIRSNPAVNRGYIPGTLNEEGRLLEFTSACSPVVYRSHLFPGEYYGNMFVMENAGNIVKRNVVRENGILLEAHDPNPGREFLASTDERFRPVHGAIGPDGGLYIVDMYHGIVQHGSYMTPYLKEQTLERGLETPVHLGRIWRVVPENSHYKKPEKLSELEDGQLISFLSHTDGWYRDRAQRLLVERNNKEIVQNLKELLINGESELGRFHALWVLEGVHEPLDESMLILLEDPSVLIQTNSLRIFEGQSLEDASLRQKLGSAMARISENASEKLALQLALSAGVLEKNQAASILFQVIQEHKDSPLIRDAVMSSLENAEYAFLTQILKDPSWQNQDTDKEIFLEMLTAAVVKNGEIGEIKELLVICDQPDFTWKEEVILGAMAIHASDQEALGLVALDSEPELFQREDLPLEGTRLEMLKRLFSLPGFSPGEIASTGNSLDDAGMKQFAQGRQKYLASCAGCHASNGKGVNRMGPPLAGSEWVLGDEKRLSLILLHGIEGPIEVAGKKYDAPDILPVMPAHSTMDDGSIAAILTYIRNEWGNQAPPVQGRTVGGVRHTSQGRVYPWSAAELNQHMESLNKAQ